MNKKPVDLEGVPEVQTLFSDMGEEARDIATQSAKLAWLNKSKSARHCTMERGEKEGDRDARPGRRLSRRPTHCFRLCVAHRSDYLYWNQCAELIKTDLEKALGPTWHVVVGDHFGAYVAHEVGKCLYFSVGQMVSAHRAGTTTRERYSSAECSCHDRVLTELRCVPVLVSL